MVARFAVLCGLRGNAGGAHRLWDPGGTEERCTTDTARQSLSMEADEQAGGPLTWPGPSTETNEASFCVKISKIAIVDSFWQGVGGGRIGLIFELSKGQSIGDDDMQELCRRVGLGPSSRRAVFTSKPDQHGTRTEKWTVNFHTLTELGKIFLELATGETSDGMVKVPCVQGGYLTEAAANARVVPTTFAPTPHGIDVTDLTMSGMNHTVKTLNRVKRDEGMRTALQGAKLFEATTMLPGAKLRAETYGAINMCYRTAAQMNGGGAVYSVHVFFKYREVSDEVALKVQNKEDDFGKLLTGEDAASENEGGTPVISIRGRGVGEGPTIKLSSSEASSSPGSTSGTRTRRRAEALRGDQSAGWRRVCSGWTSQEVGMKIWKNWWYTRWRSIESGGRGGSGTTSRMR